MYRTRFTIVAKPRRLSASSDLAGQSFVLGSASINSKGSRGTIFLNQFLSIVKGLKLCHSFTNFLAEDQVPLSP